MKCLAFCIASAAVAWAAPQEAHQDSAAIEAGQKLFVKSCSGCHGANAKGGRGPDLTTGNWHNGASDEEIQHNILNGIAGTQMPAFPLAEDEVRSIVAWLRSLRAGSEEPIKGDSARGRQLFFGAAGCSRCHMVGGRGGRLGPDLSTAGAGKKPSELRKAILDPDDSLAEGFETVEVEFRGGRTLRGVKKNDDAFSIQIFDEQERLHLVPKQDLAKITLTHKSLMPAPKLEPAQVEDVIAFLHNPQPFPPLDQWRPSGDFNVTFARLTHTEAEPENWLTYWGDLRGTHYSRLEAVTPANASSLAPKWTFQFGAGNVETSPLVVGGVMFVTGPLNDAAALDARSGQAIWRYSRRLPNVASQCTVMTNRGFGVLGDRLFLATLDAHLVALDAKTGNVLWDTEVADYRKGFSITHAPLALDGKIIVGLTSGECALTGFIDAYDASTGKRLWRVHSIPQRGEPGRETWSGDSADYGGSPTWMTGTYDAETDTLFWTTGNPGPDYDGTVRVGDNLYSCSVLALDPSTGKLKWYFQFTPHDVHDWDATETPVLIDAEVRGEPRKLLIQANRNGFYYALDRVTGKFVLGKPFALQTWARGLDDSGRPMVIPKTDPTPEGNYVCPDASGATNFAAPSYSPQTGLFYVTARDVCATYFRETKPPRPGEGYTGGDQKEDTKVGNAGSIRAIDPRTGDVRWNYPLHSGSWSAGVLSTAGGVVFASSKDGNLIALDAQSGTHLWHYQTGGEIMANPITYSVDGKQYVAVASTSALFVFGLR